MVKANEFSAGLMHKMALALAKLDFTPEELNQLCEDQQKLIRMVDVFRGYGHVTKRQWRYNHFLEDLPACEGRNEDEPVRLKVLFETEMEKGKYIFTRHADGLYVGKKRIELHEASPATPASTEHKAWYDNAKVYEELRVVSNASSGLAKFLLRYPHLIPAAWFPENHMLSRDIIFPGTVLSNITGEHPYAGPHVLVIRLHRNHLGKASIFPRLVATEGTYGEGLSHPSAMIIK